jgi:hypothetical protein
MSYLTAITVIHTAISLVAIVAGGVAIVGVLRSGPFRFWTKLFLVTAVVTNVTGFFFPLKGITPAQIVGVLALLILAIVLVAFYRFHVAKAWRWIYAAGMVASLYLLVFVGVVQAFQKIAFLKGLAPTGSELPFLLAQGATLVFFIGVGIAAALRYHPQLAWHASESAAAGVH